MGRGEVDAFWWSLINVLRLPFVVFVVDLNNELVEKKKIIIIKKHTDGSRRIRNVSSTRHATVMEIIVVVVDVAL